MCVNFLNNLKIKNSQTRLNVPKNFSKLITTSEKQKCCKVEAVITIDSKGQIVLPKDVREKAKLKPNEKLVERQVHGNHKESRLQKSKNN